MYYTISRLIIYALYVINQAEYKCIPEGFTVVELDELAALGSLKENVIWGSIKVPHVLTLKTNKKCLVPVPCSCCICSIIV